MTTKEQDMKLISQVQEEAFEKFKYDYPIFERLDIPNGMVRLCFFSGYFAALDDLEKLMPNEYRQTQGSL